ncbi:MAG: hypothetical protein JWP79_3080 [Polaromonas sp.]|jgi:uncharacterized membrane protein|nr:hypothetical protein [Polaromonas sp.]MDB5845770.1 hypothetical protein [Polaromonas sp.]
MTVPRIRSLKELKDYDESRPSFPGEHWLTLGAGLALLMASGRSRSWVMRTAGSALGSALLYRAASGRDGLAKVLPFLPMGQRRWF